jgi:HEAT repeat protein
MGKINVKRIREMVKRKNIQGLIGLLEFADYGNLEVINALVGIGKPAVESLIDTLLTDTDLWGPPLARRAFAARCLGEIGDRRAVDPLIKALNDNGAVPVEAAMALGKIADPRAAEPLFKALIKADELDERVEEISQALGNIASPQIVEKLVKAMKKKNEITRGAAIIALGEIADPGTVELLIQTLNDKEPYVRCCAAEALGKIGDAKALDPLEKVLEDKHISEDIRITIEEAIEKIKSQKNR